jgi:hypothetical protein
MLVVVVLLLPLSLPMYDGEFDYSGGGGGCGGPAAAAVAAAAVAAAAVAAAAAVEVVRKIHRRKQPATRVLMVA